jgi:hypothetical protein
MVLDNATGFTLLVFATAIVVVVWIVMRLRRRNSTARYHPRLQKYAGEESDLAQQRRAEADKIVATSSTSSVAGYELLRQVEAVYVEGFRRPDEALEGLKAVAAMKGANAVINVRNDRSAGGKCSASGDAVIVHKDEA